VTGPLVAVGAIVTDDAGRLLVVRRAHPPAQGRWTVPGGHVERGEGLRQAVAREVLEETGLTIDVGALVGVAERIGEGHHHVILDYLGEVVAGTLAPASDATAAAWLGRQALEQAGPTDGLLTFLDDHGITIAP